MPPNLTTWGPGLYFSSEGRRSAHFLSLPRSAGFQPANDKHGNHYTTEDNYMVCCLTGQLLAVYFVHFLSFSTLYIGLCFNYFWRTCLHFFSVYKLNIETLNVC
jgi:hypothetical protein